MTNYTLKYILGRLLQNAINLYQGQAELSWHYPKRADNVVFDRQLFFADFPLQQGKQMDELMQVRVKNARREVKIETIPLNRGKDTTKVLYISAIALKLAPVWHLPPMTIATELANYCRAGGHFSMPPVCTAWEKGQEKGRHTAEAEEEEEKGGFSLSSTSLLGIDVVPPGMVVLELTDSGIAQWLEYFCTQLPRLMGESQKEEKLKSLVSEYLFKIQYSHARCCSLLRMAHRDRLITLDTYENSSAVFSQKIEIPSPIPWQETDGRLRLDTPVERRLISQLFATSDALYFPRATSQQMNWEKFTHTLSEAFQNFYRKCRIWGEVKIDNPQLGQARLGLVLATQSFLGALLQEKLGIEAPREL